MKHDWTGFERGEWCRQCGTYRTELLEKFEPDTGASLGKFCTYYEVGAAEPRDVPAMEAVHQWTCPSIPRGYVRAIQRWVEVRETWGRPSRSSDSFGPDLDHSALFQRIIAGKELFQEPPPLAFSYPNYPLLENGWCEPFEVWVPPAGSSPSRLLGANSIIIDQHRWEIIETVGEEEWIITYLIPDRESIRLAWRDGKKVDGQRTIPSKTRWRVKRTGSRILFDRKAGKFEAMKRNDGTPDKLWRTERLPDAT